MRALAWTGAAGFGEGRTILATVDRRRRRGWGRFKATATGPTVGTLTGAAAVLIEEQSGNKYGSAAGSLRRLL